MTDRFAACLAETLRHEGGWSDDPHDPGGPTMRGVTIRVYAGHIGIKLDGRDRPVWNEVKARLRHVTDAEIAAIYRQNYWAPVRADELPAGLDFAAVDFCYNSGAGNAIKSLQRVLGVTIDGHFGAATMGALRARAPAELIHAYLEQRRRFYRSLPTFWRFGKGWLKRAGEVEAMALATATAGPGGPLIATAAAPLPDADAQSATQGRAVAPDPKPPKITEMALAATGAVSNFTGFSNGFSKWGAKPDARWHEVLFFFLAEPMVLAGIATTFAALTTWLWRRRFAQ